MQHQITFNSFICILLLLNINMFAATSSQENLHFHKDKILIQSASELDYPPFCVVTSQGKADGFSVELMRAALKTMGKEVTFKVDKWDTIKDELIQEKLDALPLVGRTPEREKVYDFTIPYIQLFGALITRNDNKDIKGIQDVKGKELIIMKGDNSEEFARRSNLTKHITTTDTFEEALKLLASGKGDVILMQELVGKQLIKKLKLPNLKMLPEPVASFRQDFCFAVAYDNKKLLAILNEGLANTKANGTYDKLYKKWFDIPEKYTQEQLIQTSIGVLLSVSVVFALIILFLYYRHLIYSKKELKKQVLDAVSELQSNHETLSKLTKNVPGTIYQYKLFPDGHASFPYASNGISEIYAVEPEDVINDAKSAFETIHPDDLNMLATSIKDSAETMNDWNIQYRVDLPKKGVRWLEGFSKPEKLEDGSILWHGYIHDITEAKRKEELMIKQSRHAAMGEMIGMIAHQWRQPLQIINMNVNSTLADIDFEEITMENLHEYSKSILTQTEHLTKTIDDFKNFFSPNQEKEDVTILSVIEETNSIIGPSLSSASIDLNISCNSDINTLIYKRELVQVILNFINNSKYAIVTNNIENGHIDIKVSEKDNLVVLKVCDNGGGISSENIQNIFDPYFTTKGVSSGTGLGLYISKTIIETHFKGTIKVYNINGGVCFEIKIPKEKGELK